jgi:hypothetical protein
MALFQSKAFSPPSPSIAQQGRSSGRRIIGEDTTTTTTTTTTTRGNHHQSRPVVAMDFTPSSTMN